MKPFLLTLSLLIPALANAAGYVTIIPITNITVQSQAGVGALWYTSVSDASVEYTATWDSIRHHDGGSITPNEESGAVSTNFGSAQIESFDDLIGEKYSVRDVRLEIRLAKIPVQCKGIYFQASLESKGLRLKRNYTVVFDYGDIRVSPSRGYPEKSPSKSVTFTIESEDYENLRASVCK